jgi:hypothetical protein
MLTLPFRLRSCRVCPDRGNQPGAAHETSSAFAGNDRSIGFYAARRSETLGPRMVVFHTSRLLCWWLSSIADYSKSDQRLQSKVQRLYAHGSLDQLSGRSKILETRVIFYAASVFVELCPIPRLAHKRQHFPQVLRKFRMPNELAYFGQHPTRERKLIANASPDCDSRHQASSHTSSNFGLPSRSGR